MAKELVSARWVHDTASFVRRRVEALLRDKKLYLSPEKAHAIAYEEAARAVVVLPGNSQRPWDGRHAVEADGRFRGEVFTIRAAIAKRDRKRAARLAVAA